MTEEQKIEALQRILQGANVAQVNLGDGHQTFNMGRDGNWQQEPVTNAETVEAEVMNEHSVQAGGTAETGKEHELCVALNNNQRQMLDTAEQKGIIIYNPTREGYDKGALASQALVAYLCGRIFCGDYTKDGLWKEGRRFDEAQYCKRLFGFDVAGTRRKTRGTGAGKSPIGHEKIDELFDK